MALNPGGWLPWVMLQFCDDSGDPVLNGKVYFYVTGTTTPQDTFAQADLDPGSANPNPVLLDANGRPPDPIFLSPTAYTVKLTATVDGVDDVELWTVDEVQDVGSTYAATFGNVQAQGSKDVTDGYIVLSTDRLVTCDSAAGTMTVTLLAASDATQMLVIMNTGANAVTVSPDGSDTINGAGSDLTLDAATGQDWPAVILFPDGVSAWYALPIA